MASKRFRNKNNVLARKHKAVPMRAETVEITHPIVNNLQPIIETRKSA